MIDRHELLATLKPLVIQLEESIRERALATPEVAAHLEHEHHKAVVAERTAMSLEEWRDGEITQAAVAWVLGCVFVRFLEDNALIDNPLISGPGGRRAAALGYREEHFRAHPEHSDREYLESAFRTVAAYPAVAAMFDQRHNPLWRLAPTADGARLLRETLAAVNPDTGQLFHDFTDRGLGTRFLGDLYQDLSEAAKKRYALLQTPDFVERFILDRTLTPAIDEFGIEDVRLIDPTCGSGHFLIGAFERLFALWREREPATSSTVLAQRCLDQIAGVDLNPFATAIARFRLVIAALHACEIRRLAEAPAFALHLATGDSLLHGPLRDGALFDSGRFDKNIAHVYESEDAEQLVDILGRGYHAVVGNPPYISGDDPAPREAYRVRYASCKALFTLVVPFMERFFELARVRDGGRELAGFVGKITGNNFMKREFGAPLIEQFLPSIDVQTVIDTSGAFIPGHGTPTILLFGRSRPPVARDVRVVDGIRGEPKQPADPAKGLVWTSIETLIDQPGTQDSFMRSGDVDRRELFTHPMILGIGRDLKKRLEAGSSRLRGSIATFGRIAASSADDVLTRPAHAWRGSTPNVVRGVVGTSVRDWNIATGERCLFPYTADGLRDLSPDEEHALWPHKALLWARRTFGKQSYRDEGRAWWSWHQVALDRLGGGLGISCGEVATHNHFVLDRGGGVFKQSAPLMKLPPGTSEEAHFALLGVLNSSTSCFWLKQVCHNKGTQGVNEGMKSEAWEIFYEFTGTKASDLPLPVSQPAELPKALDHRARERSGLLENLASPDTRLATQLASMRQRDETLTCEMISLQEELDWQVLAGFGMVADDLPLLGGSAPPIELGQRAFEIVLARQVALRETETAWFERHGSTPITEVPREWPEDYRNVVERRIALIESDPDIGLIERPEHKRRWSRAPWEQRQHEALTALILDALEDPGLWSDVRLRSTNELTDVLRRVPLHVEALELLAERTDTDLAATVQQLVAEVAVPQLAAQRLAESGLRKHTVWARTWELQRSEDRGQVVGTIPVPPKYTQADFRSSTFWRHRGKLDVANERFVLISNAERGADQSPVVGWAGWDERDLGRAVAARVMELREEEAVGAERVTPLLAGILELLPWIHQWHPDSDVLYGGPPGQYFESWLDGQLAELGITRDNLRAWRPPAPTRGRKAKAGAA